MSVSPQITSRAPAPLRQRVGVPGLMSLLLLLAACDPDSSAAPPAPIAVRTAPVELGPAAPILHTTGVLLIADELRLSFKVGGVVRSIAVQEGQHVSRGQVLAQLEQAEIDAQLQQAQQAVDKGQRDTARGEKLYAEGMISLGQLEDLHTQAATALSVLKSVLFNRRYTMVIAPQDGTVLRRLARPGEIVAVGAPVVVLGAHERGFVVRAGLTDRDVVQTRLGDRAVIRLDAYPGRRFQAQVTEVAGEADQRNGLFQVELRLESAEVALTSGLIAKIDLAPYSAGQGQLPYVPIAAVIEGDGERASVYIYPAEGPTKGIVKRRPVRIAFIDGIRVAIAEGVQVGEQVVTDGALYVADGDPVMLQSTG